MDNDSFLNSLESTDNFFKVVDFTIFFLFSFGFTHDNTVT